MAIDVALSYDKITSESARCLSTANNALSTGTRLVVFLENDT